MMDDNKLLALFELFEINQNRFSALVQNVKIFHKFVKHPAIRSSLEKKAGN